MSKLDGPAGGRILQRAWPCERSSALRSPPAPSAMCVPFAISSRETSHRPQTNGLDRSPKIRSLKSMPQRHEVIPEAQDLGVDYRHIISGNYRTIYRINEDWVIVLRVIHAARLLDQSLLSG